MPDQQNPKALTVEFTVPRPQKRQGETPAPRDPVPRIARLLALAWKWELAVRRGEVKDYAEIARRMELSRARVTQICALQLLAPSIQGSILADAGGVIPERNVRLILSHCLWEHQWTRWIATSGG